MLICNSISTMLATRLSTVPLLLVLSIISINREIAMSQEEAILYIIMYNSSQMVEGLDMPSRRLKPNYIRVGIVV